MKLMIVGSDKIYSIENFYVKYLREAGVELLHFPAQRFFYDYYQQGILHKLIFRAGLSGILKSINQRFKKEVESFSPDAIWVFKGMELFPESLKWAKARGIKLLNFNGDNPFLFSGKGSGNVHVSKSIELYDLHLSYNREVKKQLVEGFGIRVAILPFGYDIDEGLYATCCAQEEIMRVCFLGNPDEYRGKFLQGLADKGIPLDLYGNDWNKYVQHPSVKIFKPIYADECWMVLRKYRVQLNLMRPHNPTTHNMRSFELGGVGAIQLAPGTEDHLQYFKAGEEIFIYNNMEECVQQINAIMALDKTAADSIRGNARNRSEESGYSYKARAMQALEEIRKLIN